MTNLTEFGAKEQAKKTDYRWNYFSSLRIKGIMVTNLSLGNSRRREHESWTHHVPKFRDVAVQEEMPSARCLICVLFPQLLCNLLHKYLGFAA